MANKALELSDEHKQEAALNLPVYSARTQHLVITFFLTWVYLHLTQQECHLTPQGNAVTAQASSVRPVP